MKPGTKLKCEMVRHGIRQYRLANELGICPTILNRKLNGKHPIAENEAAAIKKAINLLSNQRSNSSGN